MTRAEIAPILLFILIAIILFVPVKNFLILRNKNREKKKISQSDAIDKEIKFFRLKSIFGLVNYQRMIELEQARDAAREKAMVTPEYLAWVAANKTYMRARDVEFKHFEAFVNFMGAALDKLGATPEYQAYEVAKQFDLDAAWEKVKATPEYQACLSCIRELEENNE
jgi:D-alanyl-lipoteichoic acid acyltransferase DltB (MBOAT superfamily)